MQDLINTPIPPTIEEIIALHKYPVISQKKKGESFIPTVQPSPSNLAQFFRTSSALPVVSVTPLDLHYDSFLDRKLIQGRDYNDRDLASLHLKSCYNSGFSPNYNSLEPTLPRAKEAIDAVMFENTTDLVLSALESEYFKWDQTPRLRNAMQEIFQVPDTPTNQVIFHDWMVALCLRQINPTFGYKYILALVDDNIGNLGKTSFLSLLSTPFSPQPHEKSFTEVASFTDIGQRAFEEKIVAGVLIVNFDDGSGKSKREANAMKSFTSRTVSRMRKAYGHEVDSRRIRYNVATTDNSLELYRDMGGGEKRFRAIEVQHLCDFELITKNNMEYIRQLWGEAYHIAKTQGTKALSSESEDMWADLTEAHREEGEFFADVLRAMMGVSGYMHGRDDTRVTNAALIAAIHGKSEQETIQYRDRNTLSAISTAMRKLGFKYQAIRVDGIVTKGWQSMGFPHVHALKKYVHEPELPSSMLVDIALASPQVSTPTPQQPQQSKPISLYEKPF